MGSYYCLYPTHRQKHRHVGCRGCSFCLYLLIVVVVAVSIVTLVVAFVGSLYHALKVLSQDLADLLNHLLRKAGCRGLGV